MKKHYRKENDCLNCGTNLQGKFCHNCGQENLELHESFGHMMNHAISDYFHFDEKFFHTLKPLFFQPGRLTNEYMAGHRAQYLHPVKMYIFISIVYFLLLFQSGNNIINIQQNNTKAETKKEIDSTNRELDNAAKDPNIPAYAKSAISLAKRPDTATNKVITSTFIGPATNDTTYQQYLASQQKLSPDKRDGFFMRTYNKKAFIYKQEYGPRAKDVFLEEFNHNIPKMMFVLLPLFALILKITFRKNKKYYVEHLIYSFHLHCFLFLLLAITILLQMIVPAHWTILLHLIQFTVAIYIIWYFYRSLRVVYHRSGFRTITKMVGMSLTYFVMFMLCIFIVIIITAYTL